ncbi:MAG: hypothetical protein M5U34_39125 [Chloroflexi bacterium]|nr:hypothetical protein [Chloroflexota bacterium]
MTVGPLLNLATGLQFAREDVERVQGLVAGGLRRFIGMGYERLRRGCF